MSRGKKEARDFAARVFRISFHDRCTFAALAREGNWSRNASRSGFSDCYWGRAGYALVSLLGSFRKGVFGRRASSGSDVFSL